MKRIGMILGALAILAVIGFFFVSSHLDRFVKNFIEKQGSAVTQTEVSLSNVTLHPLDGQGELSNLIIGNPKGFSKNFAIEFSKINMAIDTASVRGTGPIIINRLELHKPHINYEVTADTKNNLQTIERNAGGYAASDKQGAADKEASAGQSRKIIIRKLIISESKLSIHHSLLKNELSAELPTIELDNLGSDKNGLTSAELTQKVVDAISDKAVNVASKKLINELGPIKAISNGALGDIGGKIQGILGN